MKKLILLIFLAGIPFALMAQNKLNIGILADEFADEYEPLLVQLKKEIRGVVGQGTTVQFQDVLENQYDQTLAGSNYQKLIQNDADIILVFGLINTIAIYEEGQYPKPTIVFGAVNRDLINIPEKQKTSETHNLTYIITPASYKEDLTTFSEIFDYKQVGILMDKYMLDRLPIKNLLDDYFSNREADYTLIPFEKGMSIQDELKDIDAIYLAVSSIIDSTEFNQLVQTINDQKIPSFSGFGVEDVLNGVLASNQPESNLEQFFRRIALNIESIQNGTNPSELPIFIDNRSQLSINYNTAEKIGFPMRYSLLGRANMVGGELKAEIGTSFSIVDIMQKVVGKNLSLASEQKNIELSEQDVKSTKSNYLPKVTANANAVYLDPEVAEIANGQNPEFSTTGNVTLEQLVYSQSASTGIDIQESINKAQIESYNAAELDALLNATVSYFNALILKTNVRIQNENLQVTKRNLEIAQQNYEAGASGKSDVLRFRSQLAQNTQGMIDAGNQLRQAFNTLNQLMNAPISTKIDIQDAEIANGVFKNYNYDRLRLLLDDPVLRPKLSEFLIGEALKNAPELKNLEYNLNAIQANYKLSNTGRYIPTVALQGQYNLAISESGVGSTIPAGFPTAPDGNYNIGLNISLPIFQQSQQNINRQTALIQEDQLNIQRENIQLNIEKQVNDILLDMISQIANIEISKISEETARENLDLTQNAYESGAVPIIQLIDAQTNFLQSQLARATANYQYLLTSMQLERAIGYFFLMHSEAENQAFTKRANEFIINQ